MAKLIDLTGQRFGKLVVLERDTDSTKMELIGNADATVEI